MMRVSSQNTHISQCSMGIYPFMEAKVEDFDKVFSKLIQVCLPEQDDKLVLRIVDGLERAI